MIITATTDHPEALPNPLEAYNSNFARLLRLKQRIRSGISLHGRVPCTGTTLC